MFELSEIILLDAHSIWISFKLFQVYSHFDSCIWKILIKSFVHFTCEYGLVFLIEIQFLAYVP